MRIIVAVVLAVLLVAACSGSRSGSGVGSEAARLVIETSDGEVAVSVEIADDDAERQLGLMGLMGRESLAEDAGMVFLWPKEIRGSFWMKDTLIPLSIAFWNGDGRIVSILDMEPCREDPCPSYDPGVRFLGALEVNQGFFGEWGVAVGDTVRLEGSG